MDAKHFEFVASIGLRHQCRQMLDEAKFLGYDIEYLEHKGLLESRFVVKGNAQHLSAFAAHMQQVERELKEAEGRR